MHLVGLRWIFNYRSRRSRHFWHVDCSFQFEVMITIFVYFENIYYLNFDTWCLPGAGTATERTGGGHSNRRYRGAGTATERTGGGHSNKINTHMYILPPNGLHFIKLRSFNLNILKTLLILTRNAIVCM